MDVNKNATCAGTFKPKEPPQKNSVSVPSSSLALRQSLIFWQLFYFTLKFCIIFSYLFRFHPPPHHNHTGSFEVFVERKVPLTEFLEPGGCLLVFLNFL